MQQRNNKVIDADIDCEGCRLALCNRGQEGHADRQTHVVAVHMQHVLTTQSSMSPNCEKYCENSSSAISPCTIMSMVSLGLLQGA